MLLLIFCHTAPRGPRFRHLERIENKLNQDVETILILLRTGCGTREKSSDGDTVSVSSSSYASCPNGAGSRVATSSAGGHPPPPPYVSAQYPQPIPSTAATTTSSSLPFPRPHSSAPQIRHLPHQPFSIPAVQVIHSPAATDTEEFEYGPSTTYGTQDPSGSSDTASVAYPNGGTGRESGGAAAPTVPQITTAGPGPSGGLALDLSQVHPVLISFQ